MSITKRSITYYDIIPLVRSGYPPYIINLMQRIVKDIENNYAISISEYSKYDLLNYSKNVKEENVFVAPLAASKDVFFRDLDVEKWNVVKTPLAISCNFLEDTMQQKDQILIAFRNWVIDSMIKKGLIEDKSNYPGKIFITRRNPKYRKITNSNEVLPLVEANGYTVIELEDYSLAKQINFFYHADDIIGVHGAGFSHISFAKAPVLDIIVDNYYSEWFLKLSESLGNPYAFMRTKGVENDFPMKTPGYHDMIIDIQSLKEQIALRKDLQQAVAS